MATIQETGRLGLGKGCTLTFHIDTSKPADHFDYHFSEVSYDGAPDSDVPEVPPHWHKLHAEHMTVLQGRVEFTMDGKSYVRSPADPVLVIPKRHVHGIRFFKGERSRIREQTDPVEEGLKKDAFFENLLADGRLTAVGALRAAYDGDTVLVLSGVGVVDEVLRVVLGAVCTWVYPWKKGGRVGGGAALVK